MDINRFSKKIVSRFDLFFWEKIGRFRYVKKMAKMRAKVVGKGALNSDQKREIAKAWGNKYNNSRYLKLYSNYLSSGKDHKLADYIPDDYYMDKVEPFFNKPLIARKNEDKNLYDLFFGDITMPRTILRYVDGAFMDEAYNLMTKDNALKMCQQYDEVIVKTASESGGGHGITFWNRNESLADLEKRIKKGDNMIVQELVKQHPEMSRLHESSINTLRIMTVMFEGQVHVMTHFVRMGVKGKRVDNVSSGGMLCGINRDGTLFETGYDEHGKPYLSHPTSGTVFKGFKVPAYDKCIELVTKAAPRLSHFAKLISWDVAVTQDGEPLLIEANLTYCDIGIYQIACGPVFGSGEIKDRILSTIAKV